LVGVEQAAVGVGVQVEAELAGEPSGAVAEPCWIGRRAGAAVVVL
jgi:hypothetical protein